MKKNVYLSIVFIILSVAFTNVYSQTIVWSENFEGDWTANWHADAGTWEGGIPTSGPNAAHGGDNCAATVLAGNYADNVETRLIRHTSFTVPSASQNPRLRFWHWYNIYGNDYAYVQLKVAGAGDWIQISPNYTYTGSNVWTYPLIDLSDYAGQSVQIAFYFKTQSGGQSTGWYIDDVEVLTGSVVFHNSEGWENGLGDWSSERGTWEVGTPTNGPGAAYTGGNCVATVLGGDYHDNVISQLISPLVTIPSADQNPRLRFWHWYNIYGNDYGYVQLKVAGTDDWIQISPNYTNTGSNVWTYPLIDLSDYAGQSVQISFYFKSQSGGQSTGWYIDDVEVLTGSVVFNNPEGWENGLGNWSSERGTWEVGTPTNGPGAAYTGDNCVATVVGGDYHDNVSSQLISPLVTIPSADQNPRLRFWHWYNIYGNDYGYVQLKVAGTDDWIKLSPDYTNTSSNTWTYTFIDLSNYAGQSVQIAFYFKSKSGGQSKGWYIDDVILQYDSQLSSENDIQFFGFGTPPQTGDATIDATAKTINIEVEYGTDVTNLISTFTLSDGASAKVDTVVQISGTTANDFTSPVTYTVTAEDGTTVEDWVVTVAIVTSVDENPLREMNIYPNPFTDETTIEFNNPINLSFSLSVYSITGNKVIQIPDITSDKITLKRGSLKSGIYIVELTGEYLFENKKVVVK